MTSIVGHKNLPSQLHLDISSGTKRGYALFVCTCIPKQLKHMEKMQA